jgi:hypothetical protein
MKNFLLDLSNDLRAKRLWPVAIVLLLALVAVPVVLSKSNESTPAPAPAASAPKTQASRALKELTAVKLDEEADSQSSPLNTFDPANPFKPPAAVIKRSKDDGSDVTAPTSPLDVGTLTGGGGTTEPSSPTPTQPPTNTGGGVVKEYEYVLDVTFSANGRSRRIKTLERLDMLPSETNPLLIFLGATRGGGSAQFLVNASLTPAGEGTCYPSPEVCTFVHLGAGSEHSFTNGLGDSYDLRINEIRKVEIDPSKARNVTKAKGLPKGPKAAAAVGASRHRFVPKLISDLVTVSSPDAEASTPASDRR